MPQLDDAREAKVAAWKECFPTEPASQLWGACALVALPALFLIVALTCSSNSAPWGVNVDPEATYAMDGIAWAFDGLMRKNDHPGTVTILFAGSVAKLGAFLTNTDVIEFGLRYFDQLIWLLRDIQIVVLAGVLLAGGIIVRQATGSVFAAMFFQAGPFAHSEALNWEFLLAPESLMISCAILGMSLVLKAALEGKPPPLWLGVAQALTLSLGLSGKYLAAPFAILGVSLFRNSSAFLLACAVAALSFYWLNLYFNPQVFSYGVLWLVNLATHKGIYGSGDAGFVDWTTFWPNMASIVLEARGPSIVFAAGAIAAIARMIRTGRVSDPVSLTLLASSAVFAIQLVATSKHIALHYMVGSWSIFGGALVLTVVELCRLFPMVSSRWIAAGAIAVCACIVMTSTFEAIRIATKVATQNRIGSILSRAVMIAGPSCANVAAMFVRAPEQQANFGGDTALNPRDEGRFSDAWQRVAKAPLLDHDSYYALRLRKDFRNYTYAQLATDYPCIIIRVPKELDSTTSLGLLDLLPDHCMVKDIHVYTKGIPCEKVHEAYETLAASSAN